MADMSFDVVFAGGWLWGDDVRSILRHERAERGGV